ncbi:hypothetical protein BGZ76_004792 [Entomortierella beljakovae]|nr:hypothetical protein BGZ76_004792 [Entomortierella beljakovae]
MFAKGAGTILWAPMQKIQSLATHPVLGQVPLTLKEAYHIGKNICLSEGVQGLWSGYTKSLSALLPYTMIYFATYEQLKQISRWIVSSSNPNEREFQHGTTGEGLLDRLTLLRQYWSISELESQRIANTKLSLDTYMMCVASAVVISSTVCQTASSIRTTFWDHLESLQPTTPSNHSSPSASSSPRNRVQLSNLGQVLRKQYQSSSMGSPASPISPISPSKTFPTSLSVVAATRASSFKYPPFVSVQFKTPALNSLTAAAQNLSSIPWKQRQHASLTTTSILPFQSTTINHQHFRGVYSGPTCTLQPQPNNIQQFFNTPINNTNPLIQQHYTSSAPQQLIKNYYNLMSNTKSTTAMTTLPFYDNEMKHAPNSTLTTTGANNNSLSLGNSSAALTNTTTKPSPTSGLIRTIARGLGPRILWTVPGVTLTTAGFEFLRGVSSAP